MIRENISENQLINFFKFLSFPNYSVSKTNSVFTNLKRYTVIGYYYQEEEEEDEFLSSENLRTELIFDFILDDKDTLHYNLVSNNGDLSESIVGEFYNNFNRHLDYITKK